MVFRSFPTDRETHPERMDDPTSDTARLERTLDQLTLVNLLLSRMRWMLRRWVIADMRKDRDRQYRILDIGAGACDIPRWIVRTARKKKISVRVTCVDHDPRVVQYARRRCAAERDIEVIQASAFDIDGSYDYVICNHLLHHLSDPDIARFLSIAHRVCTRRFVCNDLLRSNWSIVGFNIFAALFMRDSFAREDGILSIRKGFRSDELKTMVHNSRWNGTGRVVAAFPGRLCIVGQKVDPLGKDTGLP
jgi:2-polyprenyl-3-methyl-5-hydroxy-6-metoxy-1,4-benzoquinol methylase